MTKFDILNLTAPHTLRELEQADAEAQNWALAELRKEQDAAAMRAKKIAAMIEEDRWLDQGEAGNPVSGRKGGRDDS